MQALFLTESLAAALDAVPLASGFGGEKSLAAEWFGLLFRMMSAPMRQITLISGITIQTAPNAA